MLTGNAFQCLCLWLDKIMVWWKAFVNTTVLLHLCYQIEYNSFLFVAVCVCILRKVEEEYTWSWRWFVGCLCGGEESLFLILVNWLIPDVKIWSSLICLFNSSSIFAFTIHYQVEHPSDEMTLSRWWYFLLFFASVFQRLQSHLPNLCITATMQAPW